MEYNLTEAEKTLLDKIVNSVLFFDDIEMETAVQHWNELGLDPSIAILCGLVPAMEEVGRLYEDQVYFIPELILCSDVLYKGLELLKSRLDIKDMHNKGKIVIGVVCGDIHDIGKNVVKMMLEISGFQVYDLGRDVSLKDFMDKVTEIKPDILCLSAMMTTTMLEMKRIIKAIKEANPNLKVLVGGAPVTEHMARRWGASGYAKDAHQALKIALNVMNKIKKEIEISR